MSKAATTSAADRAQVVLASTVVGLVIVSCLYWAQTVFIPVALAVFLTFLLSPLVAALQRVGLGRAPAVILAVLLTAGALGGVGWAVTHQVMGLVENLPTYTETIKTKVKDLREMTDGSGRLGQMVRDITAVWQVEPAGEEAGPPARPAIPPAGPPGRPAAVNMQAESPAWLARLPAALGSAAETLGGLGLALVLVLFMLLKREDLRNRLLRLIGHGRLTVSTKVIDEAGTRISRFLVMQLLVNGTYGLAVTAGLLAIGVDYAVLWGFLAAVLRYIPYLGAWLAAVLPITLSVAMFPGWTPPLLVVGMFVTLELVSNNLMEPWLFGKSMGVSEVALLVSAAFWAFLWGPIGLVLSSPLTICLVVLGRYVPHLAFLDILLGDEPALDPQTRFYQRLLARDQDEAATLLLAEVTASSAVQVYDAILVPALNYAKQDRERDDLSEADEQFILRATREIVEDLGERQEPAATPAPSGRVRLLGCPGQDEGDRLALEMLRQLLDSTRWDVEVLSTESLSAELVILAGAREPAVVCIGALPPGGLAHTRFLCKRLRARLPGTKIVVGRWGLRGNVEQNQDQLREAGADQVETTLLETRAHLDAWLPVLAGQDVKPSPNGVMKRVPEVTV